jgi:hypothetical protein
MISDHLDDDADKGEYLTYEMEKIVGECFLALLKFCDNHEAMLETYAGFCFDIIEKMTKNKNEQQVLADRVSDMIKLMIEEHC